jgi:hypothetical protein
MWDDVLRRMLAELVGGWEVREAIWERRCWGGGSGAGVVPEGGRLSFAEVEKMCKRLNINSSPEELERLFNVSNFSSPVSQYLLTPPIASRLAETELPGFRRLSSVR